jgi:hypothetical protein
LFDECGGEFGNELEVGPEGVSYEAAEHAAKSAVKLGELEMFGQPLLKVGRIDLGERTVLEGTVPVHGVLIVKL